MRTRSRTPRRSSRKVRHFAFLLSSPPSLCLRMELYVPAATCARHFCFPRANGNRLNGASVTRRVVFMSMLTLRFV